MSVGEHGAGAWPRGGAGAGARAGWGGPFISRPALVIVMMNLRRRKHTAWSVWEHGAGAGAEHGAGRNMGEGQASSQLPTGPEPSIGRLDWAGGTDGARRGKAAGIGPHITCGKQGHRVDGARDWGGADAWDRGRLDRGPRPSAAWGGAGSGARGPRRSHAAAGTQDQPRSRQAHKTQTLLRSIPGLYKPRPYVGGGLAAGRTSRVCFR